MLGPDIVIKQVMMDSDPVDEICIAKRSHSTDKLTFSVKKDLLFLSKDDSERRK